MRRFKRRLLIVAWTRKRGSARKRNELACMRPNPYSPQASLGPGAHSYPVMGVNRHHLEAEPNPRKW